MIEDTRTHYVEAFPKRRPLADGRQIAVCEAYVTPEQIAQAETLPTCWGCAAWLEYLNWIEPVSTAERQVA